MCNQGIDFAISHCQFLLHGIKMCFIPFKYRRWFTAAYLKSSSYKYLKETHHKNTGGLLSSVPTSGVVYFLTISLIERNTFHLKYSTFYCRAVDDAVTYHCIFTELEVTKENQRYWPIPMPVYWLAVSDDEAGFGIRSWGVRNMNADGERREKRPREASFTDRCWTGNAICFSSH